MQLVQDMENGEDRDSEKYVDKLERVLDNKLGGIAVLRKELENFRLFHGEIAMKREIGSGGNQPGKVSGSSVAPKIQKASSNKRLSVSSGRPKR